MDIDAPVATVGDGAHRRGHLGGADHFVSEVVGEGVEIALGHGSLPAEADGRHRLGGDGLDLGEVVAPRRHLGAQLGIGGTGLVACRGGRREPARQLLVQRHDVLEGHVGHLGRGAEVGESQAAVDLVPLCLLEGDFEGGPPGRRFVRDECLDLDAEGCRERIDEREIRLLLAVLEL